MIELVERCGAMAGDTSGAGGRSPSGSEGEEAFFVFDLGDLCVRHVNAAAERLTGVGVEAWPGKRLSDVLACERGAELREAASLWLANGVVLPPLRGSIRRPAGPPSPVVVRLFPVPNGEGVRGLAIARPPGVGHGPEALAAGGETGQAGGDGDAPGPDAPRSWEVGPMVLLDRPEALAVVDCQTGGVHDCNAALEALTGRGRLELLGRPISLLFADEGAGPAFARGDGCGPGDVPPEGECALRRKSGEVFLAEQRGSVLRGPCGTPRYRLCLFREVVLADQFGGAGRPLPPHELLAALRGADLAPVVVLDPGGAITYASPAAARLLGRDASELIGLRYGSVAELPGAPGGEPLAPALGDGEAGAGVRHAVPLPGGGRRVLGVTSAPLTCPAEGGGCGGPAGEYRGLVLYLTDLTGEEEARRELARLRHRLDEAELLAGLGLQAGSIAHDFKNLLTGILGNANLARFQVAPGSPLEAHLAQIETIAERAADMCKQLLAYSGRDRFRPGPIDLGALARDAAELVRFSLGPRVRLELDLADILPPIQGDPTQLRQVILNLVLNASEAIG
ncbi:MAG TPA: PAS domain-containing protein, partial [Gemmataceae bacterium]